MALELYQLSDKLQRLDWGNSVFVDCSEFYIVDSLNVNCCLCNRSLKASDENSHALIGGTTLEVEELICKIYYLCRNCKKQCTICGHKEINKGK
jgi:hypothetical protein